MTDLERTVFAAAYGAKFAGCHKIEDSVWVATEAVECLRASAKDSFAQRERSMLNEFLAKKEP